MIERVPPGVVPIVTPDPYAGWARVAGLFHPRLRVRLAYQPVDKVGRPDIQHIM